ncbi:MAG: 2Fe-2S iron-sulfur cluster-binding protein [Nitriliruptor sp.]|uniref:ferredoxin reductase n=1 Tax=Nitriliruptor sp. TaxID=2448056 RepID=UPI0034A01E24
MTATDSPVRDPNRFVPERAQEAGGSMHAGPIQARTRQLPRRLQRVLRSRVVDLATTPHGVDHYLSMVNPLWSLDRTRALLVDRIRETHDVTTLVLDPGPAWGPHEAGQHVRTQVDIDGRRRTRYFTISSSPRRADGLITLTVKAGDDAFVSRFLQTHARPGLVLEISEPRGEFVLPSPLPDHLLFIGGGSGITPLMSMTRTLLADGYRGRITFLNYVKTPADRIFAAELDRIDAHHDRVTLVTVCSEEDGDPDTLCGYLEQGHLDQVAPDWREAPAYVCGPPPMLDAAEAIWEEAGALDRFHIERFTLAAPSADVNAEGCVKLADSDIELANDGRPLLVQAEEAGLEPEYGCRMGICKTCTTRKVKGVTQSLTTGEVSSDDDQDIQICVNVALGDVELAL